MKNLCGEKLVAMYTFGEHYINLSVFESARIIFSTVGLQNLGTLNVGIQNIFGKSIATTDY